MHQLASRLELSLRDDYQQNGDPEKNELYDEERELQAAHVKAQEHRGVGRGLA
jgi:hypothetical protein